MANTIAGVNLDAIAQGSLPALQTAFLPLRAFSSDFSTDIATQGQSVTTRYPTVPTAQDLSANYNRTDTTLTSIKIDLNTYYGFVWGFNDLERSKSSVLLNDIFIDPAITAVATKVFADLWNLLDDTNYPAVAATELTSTAANFDRDDVADIAAQLTINKVPKSGRSLILHPTHYGALAKDLNAADSAGQVVTLGEHRLPRLHGFDVYECADCDGNSVNVAGLACYRSNIIMAARQVDVSGADSAGVEVSTVTIPDLGLPIQFRRWYDPDTGYLKYMMGILYGIKFGIPNAGLKIVTA